MPADRDDQLLDREAWGGTRVRESALLFPRFYSIVVTTVSVRPSASSVSQAIRFGLFGVSGSSLPTICSVNVPGTGEPFSSCAETVTRIPGPVEPSLAGRGVISIVYWPV